MKETNDNLKMWFGEKRKEILQPQHLEEGLKTNILSGLLAAGGIIGGTASYNKYMSQNSVPSEKTNIVAKPKQVTRPITQVTQQTIAPQTTPPTEESFVFHNDHVKKLYGALVSAEHRGNVTDPYAYDPKLAIRTKAGNGTSSAYGPLQITRNTARGYADPNNAYHTAFVNQGSEFLKAKNNDVVHGLGGKGTLSDEEYHDDYQQLAQHVMFGKASELGIDITKPLNPKEFDAFVQHWRHGKGSGKSPEKWYTDTTRSFYFNK
jgi:hypothetical protein